MTERMDRMEKMLEDLIKSQKETSRQMEKTDKQIKETDKQMEKTRKEEEKTRKEEEKVRKEEEKVRKEEEKVRKEEERIRKEEYEKDIKKLREDLWWIWRSQEEVWIDLFRRNMKSMMRNRWIEVDDIATKFKNRIKLDDGSTLEWEYDLMWINGKDIVVVEVKNKMRNDYIKKFVEKQLPKFKILFPQYKNYTLYGWIWGLIVWSHQEKLAEKAGLFVFTQGKDWQATLMNSKDFKAKVF